MPPLICFQYWGKARPTDQGPGLHLLPYHCLDVAAVGRVYLDRSPALRSWLAEQLGTADESAVCDWLTFWLALHDLGKFSISFQAQRIDLVERLQAEPPGSLGIAGVRHDSLGMQYWRDFLEPAAEEEGWFGSDPEVFGGIGFWVRAVTGHHGQPPQANVSQADTVAPYAHAALSGRGLGSAAPPPTSHRLSRPRAQPETETRDLAAAPDPLPRQLVPQRLVSPRTRPAQLCGKCDPQRARARQDRSRCARRRVDEVLGTGYGIFAGRRVQPARLRFSAERALWVSAESWHPKQRGQFEPDGSYLLELPYADPRELAMDILRHVTEVEALGPVGLREEVKEKLRAALARITR